MTQEKLDEAWARVEKVLEKHNYDKGWLDLFKHFWTEGFKEGNQAGFTDGAAETRKREDR